MHIHHLYSFIVLLFLVLFINDDGGDDEILKIVYLLQVFYRSALSFSSSSSNPVRLVFSMEKICFYFAIHEEIVHVEVDREEIRKYLISKYVFFVVYFSIGHFSRNFL